MFLLTCGGVSKKIIIPPPAPDIIILDSTTAVVEGGSISYRPPRIEIIDSAIGTDSWGAQGSRVRISKIIKPTRPSDNLEEDIGEQLGNGVIAFKIPTAMIVGQTYRAELRIDDSITIKLTENLEGHQPIISVTEGISQTMRVTLIGDAFTITPLTSETQLRKINKPTIWLWDVVPKKSGTRTLIVKATAVLKRPGFSDETYDYDTIEEHVTVNVDPVKTITDWIVKNWLKGALTAIGTALLGWIARIFKKKKSKKKNDKEKL